MFPQRNRFFQQTPFGYSNPQQPYMGYIQTTPKRGVFTRRHMGVSSRYQHSHSAYQQQLSVLQNQPMAQPFFPQQPKQSLFRDDHGKLDFQKIGNGVQTAMGLANQVSPVMKMIGGFFK